MMNKILLLNQKIIHVSNVSNKRYYESSSDLHDKKEKSKTIVWS